MIRAILFLFFSFAASGGSNIISIALATEVLPQLDTKYYPSQLFWLVTSFVFLYLVISRIVMPRISSILQNRMRRIDADLSAARKYRREIEYSQVELEEAMVRARQQAQDFLSSNYQSQKEIFQQQIASQLQVIATKINENEADIAAKKRDALAELITVSVELVEKCVVLAGGKKPTKAVVKSSLESSL